MASRANSKSQKIRDYLATNPGAATADVVAGLKANRVRVTAAHVYNVKATAGKRRKAKAKPTNGIDVAALVKAKKLVGQLGGIDQARATVAALAKLL